MKFNKVAIIGVGLIGGSIGLAIKKKHLAKEVIGVFRRQSTLKRALKHNAIDRGTMSIKDGAENADLIILATPVLDIPGLARDVISLAKKGAIITDVGSTKKWIIDEIEGTTTYRTMRRPYRNISFVGSHPMAGSEHAGVEFARSDLLKGSPCIVTKTAKTDKAALKKVISFWKALGAKVKVMTPSDHDMSVSLISHLPHIVAFSLAGAVPVEELAYAAEGFKDTTRVASSDPRLWTDIFFSNSQEIVNAAAMFEKKYKKLVEAVKNRNHRKIMRLLGEAKAKRDKLMLWQKSLNR